MTTQSTSYIASLHTLLAASVYIVYDRHKSFLTSFTGVICIASIKLHRVTACVDSQRSSCQFNFGFHFIPLQKKLPEFCGHHCQSIENSRGFVNGSFHYCHRNNTASLNVSVTLVQI